MDALVVVTAALVGAGVWTVVFALPQRGRWRRITVGAAVLIAFSVAVLVAGADGAGGRLADLLWPVLVADVLLGLGVGGLTLMATHAAYRLVTRWAPGVAGQIGELYALRAGGARGIWLPIAFMAVGEELLFRGVVQGRAGLLAGVAVYAAVQLPARKWALVLAAAALGAVWGALLAWRGSLIAPIVAHGTWTLALALLWPLPAGHGTIGGGTPDPRLRDPSGDRR